MECFLHYHSLKFSHRVALELYDLFPPQTCPLVTVAITNHCATWSAENVRSYVVVCTALSGKDQHRQVSVDRVVILGVVVRTLARNAKDANSRSNCNTSHVDHPTHM